MVVEVNMYIYICFENSLKNRIKTGLSLKTKFD